jgi:lysophospholipase L1-like esterase
VSAASSWHTVSAKSAVGTAVALVLLLAVEGALRTLTFATSDPVDPIDRAIPIPMIVSPDYGWVLRPEARTLYKGQIWYEFDQAGYRAIDTAQILDRSRPKIAFVGDSNTFGWKVRTEKTFAEIVETRLSGVDAVNLGVPGYSSYQGRLVVRERLRELQPRIVVISFNFNDRRATLTPDGPDRALSIYRQSHADGLRGVERWLERHSRLYLALQRVLRPIKTTAPSHEGPVEVRIDQLVPRVDESQYRENLTTMVTESLDQGVQPVFLLLRDSQETMGRLRPGVASYEAGDMAETIRQLLPYTDNPADEYSAMARWYVGHAYQRQGNPEGAQAMFLGRAEFQEVDGGYPFRPDTPYNDIMREVAHAMNVPLIDATGVLDAHSEVFTDMCHFNEEGHRLVGELAATALAPLLK